MAKRAALARAKYVAVAEAEFATLGRDLVLHDPLHFYLGLGAKPELVHYLWQVIAEPASAERGWAEDESHPGQYLLTAVHTLGPGGRMQESGGLISVADVVAQERRDPRYWEIAESLIGGLSVLLNDETITLGSLQRYATRRDLTWHAEALLRDAAWRGATFGETWRDSAGNTMSLPRIIDSQIAVYELGELHGVGLSTGGGGHLAWILALAARLFETDSSFKPHEARYGDLAHRILEDWTNEHRQALWQYSDGLRDAHFLEFLFSTETRKPPGWAPCELLLNGGDGKRLRTLEDAVTRLTTWIDEPDVVGWGLQMHAIRALDLVSHAKCPSNLKPGLGAV